MDILVEQNYESMSQTAARLVAREILLVPDLVLGLATGNTPVGFYSELVKLHEENLLDYSSLKTFNLDEYVYEALRAGASGFLLKGAPLPELIAGVRTVAKGEALLAPSVTRRLIGEYALRIRPADPAPPMVRHEPLTEREHEVLLLIAEGLSNREIAERMTIAHETVKTHVSRILTKLRLRDRVQA
ncbi:MAG: LuxR C-terminal-related transcriptional regulator, partial [Candidatus Acetothermia bacterium]